MRRAALCALLVLAACHSEPDAKRPSAEGPVLLRAVYRDASSTMVLVIPEAGKPKPLRSDCTAPMLIDTLTGAARVLTDAEAQARLRTMQLVAAAPAACSPT
ncbi:MAG: hypothetical protein ACKVOL_14650 [Novosphingobium sp.]